MIQNFDEVQKFGKENFDVALKSFGAVSTKMQAIAAEVADYSKKSFEDSTAVVEKLMGAKTVEKAIDLILPQVDRENYAKHRDAFVASVNVVLSRGLAP